MGLVGKVFAVLGVLVLAIVGLGSYLWFSDYEAKATVTEKRGTTITIVPDLWRNFEVKHQLTSDEAQFVCVGYRVHYRINSGAFQVFDQDGDLVFDSDRGLVDAGAAARCGATGSGGGGAGILGV